MARPKLTFDEWKAQVDIEISNRCGLTADDLPDVDYMSMFEDGESPKHAALEAINSADS